MELGKHPRAAEAGTAPSREKGDASGRRLLGRLERRDERVGLRERRAVAAAEVVRRARRHRRPTRPRLKQENPCAAPRTPCAAPRTPLSESRQVRDATEHRLVWLQRVPLARLA